MSFIKNTIANTVINLLFVVIYGLYFTNTSKAATYCVANEAELLNVLAEATSNGQNDRIQIQQGTYTGNFIYESTEPYGVTIAGDYTEGCTVRVVGAAKTVLDAQNSGRVLTLNSPSVAADFSVIGLAIQNGNVTGNFGGGLYISTGPGKIALTGNRISNNTSNTSGGGSYIAGNGSSVTLTNNMITQNTAVDGGGAVISGGGPDGSVFLAGNLISNNTATDSNGGLSVRGEKEINLINNHVKDNIAGGGGGAISVTSCQKSIITNNVISDNSANGDGAGLYINIDSGYPNALITIINNTINRNSAVSMGGGLYLSLENDNQIANIYNNILLNNSASEGADLYIRNDDNGNAVASIINLFHNDFDQSSDGTYIQLPFPIDPSNLDNEDPLFHVNYSIGDSVESEVTHFLRSDSPCIDAGASQNAPPDDIDGDPRPWGAGVDIGADEFIPIEDYWTDDRMRNADPIGAPTIKIMPLGDSITRGISGSSDDIGYRRSLYLSLTAAGYDVNFVGNKSEGIPNDFDKDHEGHSGWRADEIVDGRTGSGEGKLSDWLLAENPNFVLLHIGTNDISDANEDWNEVEDILNVIDDYEFASGKAVWVVLSLIIDRSCDPYIPFCLKSLETSNYNEDIRDFVYFPREAGGDKIVLLDMQNDAGINYEPWNMGGDMWDDVHPFQTGYDKMADLWLSALLEILPQADAGSEQIVYAFDRVMLDASKSANLKNGNLSYQWVQTAGIAVVLSDHQAVQPTFVAPDVGPGGETLTFRVTVTDEDGLQSADTVSVVVGFSDSCPNDPRKVEPGVCGCGVADVDTDGGGTFDCGDSNGDSDGVPDLEEQGPDGNNPNYDGNDDGSADRFQNNVTSLHTYDDRKYVTIESPVGTSINNGKAVGSPAGSGGGCLISSAAYGFPRTNATLTLILLLGSILMSLSALKPQKKPKS